MSARIKFSLLAILLLAALAGAQSFSFGVSDWATNFPANYTGAYNITVNNWHYVQTYGSSTYQGNPEPYVLAKIPASAGDPSWFLVKGYSAAGQLLGNVTFYIVSTLGGSSILIYNKTAAGDAWATATVYYGPLITPSSFDHILQNIYSIKNISVLSQGQQALQQTPPICSVVWTPSCDNITIRNYTLSTIQGGTGDVVFLSNSSLIDQNFTLSFSPASQTYL